jgi:hypothetical protein
MRLNFYKILTGFTIVLLATLQCNKDESPFVISPEDPPMITLTVTDLGLVNSIKPYGEEIERYVRRSSLRYLSGNSLAPVISVTSGLVDSVVFNSDANYSDYRIRIRVSKDSQWYIVYNHVAEVSVKKGDVITNGKILGRVGTGDLVDLQVSRVITDINGERHEATVCPSVLFHNTAEMSHYQFAQNKGLSTSLCSYGSVIPYYSEPWRDR